MKDTQGREYAKLSELDSSSWLKADSGFTCLTAGKKYPVYATDWDESRLFIPCREGKHFLDGQLGEDGDSLIGFYPA